jgi:hypothetical protein
LVKAPEKSPAQKVAQEDVKNCIETFVLGVKRSKYETLLEEQEKHLQTYLKALSKKRKMLKDLLDPNVLSKFHANSIANANRVDAGYDDFIKSAFQVFKRIPGALETIDQFLQSSVDNPREECIW